MTGRSVRGRDLLALLAILLVTLLPRVVSLGADPPLDFQTGFLADEGAWAHNARNYVLFGRWVMDQHNPGLIATPLYSGTLVLIYRAIGVGLLQTRLLAAVSGALACVVLFLALRAAGRGTGRSLVPPLILGFSYFMLTNNRVAFTESYQLLFIAMMFAGLVAARRRTGWAALAGLAFLCAMLVKPSAIVMGLVAVVFWWLERGRTAADGHLAAREFRIFGLTAIVAVLAAAAVLAVTVDWAPIAQQLSISLRNVFSGGAHPEDIRPSLAGLGVIGFTLNGFVRQCLLLLIGTLWYAAVRLSRSAAAPADTAERLCWVWLSAALCFLSTQQYQPDRRFLLLLPPLAVLFSGLLSGGFVIPARERLSGWRAALIGALAGALAGLLLQGEISRAVAVRLDLTTTTAASLIWNAGIGCGALVGWLAARLLPARPFALPAWLPLAGFLLTDPLASVRYLRHPHFSVPEIQQAFGRATAGWPPEDRVIVGTVADALVMPTDFFAFTIRRRASTGAFLNLDGWTRFRPAVAVVTTPPGKDPLKGDVDQRAILAEVRARGYRRLLELPTRYDRAGRPTWVATFYARTDLVESER
ncbi:MAG: hypothetical protein AB7I33_01050 [Gemmatimonadales bacterium]